MAGGHTKWEAVRNWDTPPPMPPPSASAHLRWQAGGSPILGRVEEREDFLRYPPVKSPRLSRWAGLGYGQAQIGENFLLMAQYDKPGPMRHVLAPVPPPWVAQCAALCAGLALLAVCAQLALAAQSSDPLSNLWTPAVFLGLFFFCCCGTVSMLPDPGISVNFRMLDDGATALHVAAQHGSLSAARMLVAEGAALEVGDVDGRTPLHHAAAHNQTELATFLLKRGANAHAADAWGKKPYQLAPERGGELWVLLGGSGTTYTYDPDDNSMPGVQPVFESKEERQGAEKHSYSLSERVRGGSTDWQETAHGRAKLGSECTTAAGVVCAAESLLIRPSTAVDDDAVPEDASGQRTLGNRSNGGSKTDEVGSGSSSSNYGSSSSDEDFDFELEVPPADALRPSVFPSTAAPDVIGVELPPGYTPGRSIGPLAAAASGALDLLQQQYTQNPASLRRCDLSGRSCMVTALENGRIEIVEWLCNLPCEPFVGSSGSAEATCGTTSDLRSWLIEESGIDSLRPLHHAILRREPRAVEALLQAGADTETRTRLSSRYTNGSIEGGVERIKRDGGREALSDADKTALLLAVTVGCHQAALAAAAEATGGTTFDPERIMAETRASRAIVRLLLEFGADIHARDQEMYTSLHIAQEANVLPLMELLLEHGAAVEPEEPVEGAV